MTSRPPRTTGDLGRSPAPGDGSALDPPRAPSHDPGAACRTLDPDRPVTGPRLPDSGATECPPTGPRAPDRELTIRTTRAPPVSSPTASAVADIRSPSPHYRGRPSRPQDLPGYVTRRPRPATPNWPAKRLATGISRSASDRHGPAPLEAAPPTALSRRAAQRPVLRRHRGHLHSFAWTGHDHFAGHNVTSIVLEVPADLFVTGREIGAWASISRRRDDGTLEQMDRGGNPTINPFINPDGEKDRYNSRQPADDVANYLEAWSKVLENAGYPPRRPRPPCRCCPTSCATTHQALATPTARPIEDVYSYRFAWLSYGKVPPQGLTPHADLLTTSPTSARPTPNRTGRAKTSTGPPGTPPTWRTEQAGTDLPT